MGGWLSRTTVLENKTGYDLEVRECPESGKCSVVVKLGPGKQETIRANKFHQHSIDSNRPRSIQVFILAPGEDDLLGCVLSSQDFRTFGGITFRLAEHKRLVFDNFTESSFRRIKVFRVAMRKKKKKTTAELPASLGLQATRNPDGTTQNTVPSRTGSLESSDPI